MKLSNLDHIQTVTKEEKNLTGGYYYYYYGPRNTASAGANAGAFGYNTYSSAHTSTLTVQGNFSGASSSSYSSSSYY